MDSPRRVGRIEQVHELKRRGRSSRAIARGLGPSRSAVTRSLRRTCPDRRPGRPTRCGLDAYRGEIDRRIADGRTNAAELHRELGARGCRPSYPSVRRHVAKRLARPGGCERANAPAPPSAKQLSFDGVRRLEDREEDQQARLDAIRGRSPERSAALGPADEFAAPIRKVSEGTPTG